MLFLFNLPSLKPLCRAIEIDQISVLSKPVQKVLSHILVKVKPLKLFYFKQREKLFTLIVEGKVQQMH